MLRYTADRRTLAMLAIYAMGMVGGFFLIDVMPLWAFPPYIAFLCCFAFITAVITHNTVHVPMFKDRRLNQMMQVVISVLFGNTVSVFVRGHNYSHHRHTQTPRDLMRTTKARFAWNFLNQALFFAIVGPDIEKGNRIYIKRERAKNTPWFRQYRIEWYTVMGLTLLALLVDWRAALLFVLVPRLFGIWCITGINFAQHDGCDDGHPYNHSRNFVSSTLNWWLFNNGFHTIHHMHPGMHWSKCAAAHHKEVVPHMDPRLDEPSMFAYLFRASIWPGRRVRYDGEPVVLGPPEPDESWIPDSEAMSRDISIGAAGS